MFLIDVLSSVTSFDEDETIFAQEKDGKFDASSEAEVIYLSDDELKLPTSEVAARYCPGKLYFLEVDIVNDLIDGWTVNHNGAPPTEEELCMCAIHYARFDAYPKEFLNSSE